MYLVRKIALSKWEPKNYLSNGEISADAIWDLRTGGSTLSFWKCNSVDNDSLGDVAMAIASKWDHLDKLDLVWLTTRDIEADGLILEETEGNTLVEDMRKRHVDLCRLDYVRLGKVAHMVNIAIKEDRYCLFSKKDVGSLLAKAVDQDRIVLNELKENLRKRIKPLINSSRE